MILQNNKKSIKNIELHKFKVPAKSISHKNIEGYKAQTKFLLNELISAEYELGNLKQILNASSDAILITTTDVKIIYVNPAWEKLTGYTLPEVVGKNPKFLKSGKTPHTVYKKMWSQLRDNQSFSNEELINKKKDGTEFTAHSTTFPVTRLNTTVYYVQFLYDISESKEQEKQKQLILAIVSHELKTPITILKLLISKYSNPKKRYQIKQEDWQNMDKELNRLTQLIDESLDISKIDSNKLNLTPAIFDLNSLIEQIMEQLSVTVGKHKIYFSTIPSLIVVADPKRIKQVLLNLLTNALKFSPSESKVEINASKNKSYAIVTVKDNGIGISKEEQILIFDKSYQVQNKSSDGLGLGLYISKEIIKKHHGKIWVTSEEDQGSTFSFTLPLKKELNNIL